MLRLFKASATDPRSVPTVAIRQSAVKQRRTALPI